MAYVYGNGFGDYGNYGGLFSKLKSAVKSAVSSVGSAVSAVAKPISAVTSKIDPTSSKSLIGQIPVVGGAITSLARQGVATSAAMMTGGLSVAAAQKGVLPASSFGVKPTAAGFATGAAVGTAILSGGSLLSTGLSTVKGAMPAKSVPVPAADVPEVSAAGVAGPAASGSGAAVAAGAGVGFLAAGPVGAALGAGVGYLFGRR